MTVSPLGPRSELPRTYRARLSSEEARDWVGLVELADRPSPEPAVISTIRLGVALTVSCDAGREEVRGSLVRNPTLDERMASWKADPTDVRLLLGWAGERLRPSPQPRVVRLSESADGLELLARTRDP